MTERRMGAETPNIAWYRNDIMKASPCSLAKFIQGYAINAAQLLVLRNVTIMSIHQKKSPSNQR
jgi:hypothetical protein